MSTLLSCRNVPPALISCFPVDIHGCALVLLLGSLCLHKVSDVEQHSLMADWDRCLTFLREYQSQSQSAPRCIRLLEVLQQEASNYSNGTSLKVLPTLTY